MGPAVETIHGKESSDAAAEKTRAIRRMFGAIAPTYDLLNRLLSFGVDARWRRAMVARLPSGPIRVLDLACGTGDVAVTIVRERPEAQVCGGDLSLPMLRGAVAKIRRWRMEDAVKFQALSAEDLPYRDHSFDAVTIAFGIRNVVRRDRALREMARVLKPGGSALLLDFSLPPHPLVRAVYGFYFHRMLPLLGGLVSGNFAAYRYLPKSVEGFPPRAEFAALMEECGFGEVSYRDFTLGVATLYRGVRKTGC
jgi:demethylmenaquinone methyltransferase/2-methoxy-6-polyprenyl-1,4-benzoquinol methylase